MSISNDVLIACADETRRGGVKRIFVAPACEIDSFTPGVSDHAYTAVTHIAPADKFYEIEGEFETKPFTGEGTTENGSNVSENSLEVFVPRMEKTKAKELNDLFAGGKVVVVFSVYDVASANDRAFVLGYDEILMMDAACRATVNQTLEAELQGVNGYTVTFAGKQTELLREYIGDINTNAGTVSFG